MRWDVKDAVDHGTKRFRRMYHILLPALSWWQ